MKNIFLYILIAGTLAFSGKTLYAQFDPVSVETNMTDKPVVVELFTSQSCSSCPPADKNLAILAKNPNVIALGFHVTYWNHLHWKDTLSRQFATDRQYAYAGYKNDNRIYTPQMIINGGEEFVGSHGGNIRRSLSRAQDVELVQVTLEDSSQIKAMLPDLAKGNYTIWLAGTKDSLTQVIASGENRGKTVVYKHGVVHYKPAGQWDGQSKEIFIDIPSGTDIDNYVVLVQKDKYGAIIAAGKTL